MISWVALVNPSHPYLENAPAPSFDPHHLRISPWLWFRNNEREKFPHSDKGMNQQPAQLSNPFSTGGGGLHFEAHIQAMFVALMLSGGVAPCLPPWPIKEVKLQNKIDGFETDDVMVVVEEPMHRRTSKLIAQIKHDLSFTAGDQTFGKSIQAAWRDFKNPDLFQAEQDRIALITGHLTGTHEQDVTWLLRQARHTADHVEFFKHVNEANFSSRSKRDRLTAFQAHLKVTSSELYSFFRHLQLLCYDLGSDDGTTLPLIYSHFSQFEISSPEQIWGALVEFVETWNQDAGTITRGNVPRFLFDAFTPKRIVASPDTTPSGQQPQEAPDWNQHSKAPALAKALLLGAWDENNEADLEIVRAITSASRR